MPRSVESAPHYPDVRRGLHKPKIEKAPVNHHIVRKTIAGIVTAATIASYSIYNKEVNNFVADVFNGVNPFPTAEASEPISAVDEYVIPEGLGVEDNNVRQSVKEMVNYEAGENCFALDLTEVKNYLATGETKDCKTFEVLNDANNKPAFVVVKGGENGFDEQCLKYLEESVARLNEIDPTIVRTMAEKHKTVFIAADKDNNGTFKRNPTWAGTYGDVGFGGYILLNESISNDQQGADAKGVLTGVLIVESRAIYTSSFGSGGGVTTNAPDRLDDKIGVDKGLYLLDLANNWLEQGKISDIDKIYFNNTANSVIAYYSKK